jgi:hypothetical protein
MALEGEEKCDKRKVVLFWKKNQKTFVPWQGLWHRWNRDFDYEGREA